MSIAELQQLVVNAITTGAFLGFIVGALLSFFGRRER